MSDRFSAASADSTSGSNEQDTESFFNVRPTSPPDESSPVTGPASPASQTCEPLAFTTKNIDRFSTDNRTIQLLPYSPSLMAGGGETGNMLPRVLIPQGGGGLLAIR